MKLVGYVVNPNARVTKENLASMSKREIELNPFSVNYVARSVGATGECWWVSIMGDHHDLMLTEEPTQLLRWLETRGGSAWR